ncbi:hypothetical protein DY000_02054521 [Brassica cretica]|uniref:Uncharacterized protein n=1 Tax=Brassica cretica TaxID=69181 RepID=A0ABQ7AF41_BRACR|nr:hypothetical protein DY000_02054521 [Brassica cretica]
MGFEKMTPLIIAVFFVNKDIVDYIHTSLVDVNRSCGFVAATTFHCTVSGLSKNSLEVVTLQLNGSADPDSRDALGNKYVDMDFFVFESVFSLRKKVLKRL